MSSYSDEVRDLVMGTLWSQWAELGLSGWERHHQDVGLDLEALIITTARLGHRDTRLRAEALDWSVSNGRIVSAIRLKRLTELSDVIVQSAIREFTATVNANSKLRWPDSGAPITFKRTGKSAPPSLERPALIQLRLRALWGVSARAEALRVMLPEADRFIGITEIATAAAYGKDAIADALESLHRGGLLDAAMSANQRVFRLRRDAELVALVGSQPTVVLDWTTILPIMAGILEATDIVIGQPLPRAADLQRRWREWQPALVRLGIITATLGTGVDFLRDYERLTARALRAWAGQQQPVVPA
jgi:hypothetical protein